MTEEIIEQAKGMGWVTEEEWRGDPGKWRPAEEFVQRGENYIPILKDRLDKSEKDLDRALKLIETQVEESRKQGYEQAKREYDKELLELRKKEVRAVEDGDVATYNAIQTEKANIRPPEEPKPVNTSQTNPFFEEWHKKNGWYQTDTQLTKFAEVLGASLRSQELPPDKFYGAIESEVRSTFPEKFANPNREKPGAIESGSRGQSKGSKKTWSDLPDDAKSAYNRILKKFEAKNQKFTKEQYVKSYFEE